MGTKAKYIKRIEITGLWGRQNIAWDLRPDVNILSGINGIGKSAILNTATRVLAALSGEKDTKEQTSGVKIIFDSDEADSISFDVIHSFDSPLLQADVLEKLADRNVKTELDWQLYKLQRKYLDYQVNIGNRIIELLSDNTPESKEQASQIAAPKRLFQDLIDKLLKETDKKIDRKTNEIQFISGDETLLPYKLSSGEKQMLVILLTVLVQDNQYCVLFMDEPEVSLHIEWQQKLIGMIRQLNPNVQIILTTHSPAVIMEGWLDTVTEVSDISSGISKS